jgi:hypothetical protein
VPKSTIIRSQVHKVNNTAYLEFAEDFHPRITKHFLLKESRMNRRNMAFTVAAFLTVAAAACDTPAEVAAPGSPRYDGRQAPSNPTDSTRLPEAGAAGDTTGRWGGALGTGT